MTAAGRTGVRLVVLLGLAWPAALRAHGVLESAQPAAGARLTAAPRALRLTFSEGMEAQVSRFVLTGTSGLALSLSPVRQDGRSTVLMADILEPLAPGRYSVAWRSAGRDGHPVQGEYVFTVLPATTDAFGAAPRDSGSHGAPPMGDTGPAMVDTASVFGAGVRWVQLVATLALIGTLAFAILVLPRAVRRGAPATFAADAEHRAQAVGRTATMALCVVAVLRLIAQLAAMRGGGSAPASVGVSSIVRDTLWGHAWILQLTGAIVALAAYLLIPRARRAGWTVVLLATVAITVAASLSGHAAAIAVQPGVAVFKDVLHVLCVGGWLGTLLLIVVAGIPAALRLAPAERGAAVASMVNVFSPLALLFAGVVVFSGVSAAWAHFAPNDDPLRTPYARVLLIKLAAVAVLAAIAAFNWRRQRPSLGDEASARCLRRSAVAELLVAAIVLAVTSVLLATPTPQPTRLRGQDRAVLDGGRAGE